MVRHAATFRVKEQAIAKYVTVWSLANPEPVVYDFRAGGNHLTISTFTTLSHLLSFIVLL